MQFFTRIIAQMLHGPLGEKLANAKWMQNLAQNTHKGIIDKFLKFPQFQMIIDVIIN